jgi:CheY-like chemotaxis protein/nitrogen-specific signal transduction histidine kinase
MRTPLRLLILEDHAAEAELMVAELRRSGMDSQWKRVDSEPEFRASVLEDWDLILADFSLPQFSALQALEVLAETGVRIPLIVVTGAVGEEMAAECIKQGAADYLLKDRLARLSSAVKQALEQKRVREESAAAHRALHENEERFRALVEHSSTGLLLLNSSGRVIERYNDLFPNREGDNWYHDDFFEWMLAEDRPAVRQMWDRLGDGIQTAQFRVSNRRGGVRWLEAVCNDLRHTPGVGAIVVRYGDVTERRELEDQFRHAQKMQAVGQLAAGLGHDFNNLLTIIRCHADLMISQADLPKPLHKGLTEIQGACRRATRLTRELLTFSRKQVSEAKVLDANRVVSDLVPLLRSLVGEDIDFRWNLEQDLGAVRVDEGELEQVIMNLVVNARDAMAGSGSITIETRTIEPRELPSDGGEAAGSDGLHILFSVSDTGSGMDAQTVARIFEPFFTTKDVGKGTGLGLSTVYAIVNHAHGRVLVESQIGKGSTFRVLLPHAGAIPEAESLDDAEPASPGANGTILVVEDDDPVRDLIVAILQPLGYQVIAVDNATEAIRCWRSAAASTSARPPIDMLITDVRMPGMKGPELVGMLRKDEPALKVLFISGCADVEDGGAGELTGASLLSKPFSPDGLVRKVREILDSPAAGRSVLVVDDDPQIRDLLRTVFESNGYTVHAAGDGKQALAMVKGLRPDIVVTDIVMPEMEGIELIRLMRQVARDVRIIAMSGSGEDSPYLKGASLLGADAAVAKPLEIDSLLATVQELLASPKSRALKPQQTGIPVAQTAALF